MEYTVFRGVNDDVRHADALARLLRNMQCRVNLIRFHAIPDSELKPVPESAMTAFRDRLNSHGITATIRASRGEDIMAACGMLMRQEPPGRRLLTEIIVKLKFTVQTCRDARACIH